MNLRSTFHQSLRIFFLITKSKTIIIIFITSHSIRNENLFKLKSRYQKNHTIATVDYEDLKYNKNYSRMSVKNAHLCLYKFTGKNLSNIKTNIFKIVCGIWIEECKLTLTLEFNRNAYASNRIIYKETKIFHIKGLHLITIYLDALQLNCIALTEVIALTV